MSAIFISYTGRDPEGDAWADRLATWFQEWNYGYFRDKDHSHGIKAGDDWRQTLYAELADARALVCLCSKQYDSSPWCVGEVAIAVEKGKTVIPIQLATTAEELKTEPLPLLLQTKHAIKVTDAANPSPKLLEEVQQQLQLKLRETLNWRDLLHWDRALAPYPGLPAFKEDQAPVFFGRDKTIEEVVERLAALALRPPAFLLLLGASGYGKSSLVRAGVVPRLRKDPEQEWLVLPPFTPGDEPFQELEKAVAEAGGAFHAADPVGSIRHLQRQHRRTLVLVIDQFEELLTAGPKDDGQDDQGEAFQQFLLQLLRSSKTRLLVVATMRTDFLAPLQARWPALTGMASTITLEPIEPEDFGELITGPADRSSLTLEPGLTARLVNDSGGRDALPLLAFTLEKLWRAHKKRGVAVTGSRPGEKWDLTLHDYNALGGVAGAVSTQAKRCWNPQTSSEEVRLALREAFLDHLVSVSGDGREAKRPAPLADLPIASREIVQRLVDDRLLVQKDGIVEIAHEALLRTWEPLVQWIAEGREELLQCLRVKRLSDDLKPEAPERQRRQALEQLAGLAASGGSEQRAVQKEGTTPLSELLINGAFPLGDREDAALVLALIGAEKPLRECLEDTAAPVALRRRAAESLGLLARRSGDGDQRQQIADELQGLLLNSEALDVRIEPVTDPQVVAVARRAAQQEVANQVQLARAAGRLEGVSEEQLLPMVRAAEEQALQNELWASGQSPGWKKHDEQLPLLQGLSRGMQLAMAPVLPLLGDGPGLAVPMLTLTVTAPENGEGLRILTEVVPVPVWQLPLPAGEQLELVLVPEETYQIGSPQGEDGRISYNSFRSRCDPSEVDVEVQRRVRLQTFAMVRHPISQSQWRAVVEALPAEARGSLKPGPGTFRGEDLWERFGQPGGLPVDSVSWNAAAEWLQALNGWLAEQWPAWAEQHPGMGATPAQLALPSESQWEAACRGSANQPTPFHFGATLDPSWARYNASYTYGKGRRGEYLQRPVSLGFFGLVNTHGLAELHGQLLEWCGDQWHRDPVAGAPPGGGAMEGADPGLAGDKEQRYRLLRGGSWFGEPHLCRAAFRNSFNPDNDSTVNGLRPCCPSPPGSLLGP